MPISVNAGDPQPFYTMPEVEDLVEEKISALRIELLGVVTPPPATGSATADLQDDFSGGFNALRWAKGGYDPTLVTFPSSTLRIDHGATLNASYNSLVGVGTTSLVGSYFHVQMSDFGNQAIASHEVQVGIELDANNYFYVVASNNQWKVVKSIAGVFTDNIGVITLNTTTHRWSRLRELSGTVYADTSPDGVVWTNRASFANPFALTAIKPALRCGIWANSTASYAIFDSVNIISTTPPAVPGTPVPTGPTGSFTLAFQDEFTGTSLDTTKWAPYWFAEVTPNGMNGVQTKIANIQVTGGNCILTLADSNNGALISTNPAGRGVLPAGGFTFTTGVVEARIWFPGNGSRMYNFPAWWSAGQPTFPTNGENDIAEVLGGDMTVNYHSAGSHNGNQGSVPGYWGGGYHIYTMQRTSNHVYVYYDGVQVKNYVTDEVSPHYLVVNVGNGGAPSIYGAGSQVKVDYVRAWT